MSTSNSAPVPSAPRLELLEHHYGSETGCDVVFLVGPTSEACLRIPAHSHILKNATPVFGAMFSANFFNNQQQSPSSSLPALLSAEGMASPAQVALSGENGTQPPPKNIPVPDLDGKAFDNLMKYLYDTPVVLQSTETTIETLKAAHKYQCAGLVRKCVNHLIGQISVENVLLITANMALRCGDFQNLENLYRECTEKDTTGTDCIRIPQLLQRRLSEPNSELNIELDCAWLVYNCLDFIDRNATTVLQSEEIEDLDYPSVHHIMGRDTLMVKESLVFDAIIRWADKECKRQHFPLTNESKRKVLHDLIYLPRYLQMSALEFQSGPASSGLLLPDEIETITHLIQIGPTVFTPVSPETSPYKRIQNLGIPTSKSLRIHLNYLLKPRKIPGDQKNSSSTSSGGPGSSDGNWKWIARLKKMKCGLLCCESSSAASLRGSRCASPTMISSPVRQSSASNVTVEGINHQPRLSISSSRENPKVGFVERAVVIFACLFD